VSVWYNFSRVSSTPILHRQFGSELTLEDSTFEDSEFLKSHLYTHFYIDNLAVS